MTEQKIDIGSVVALASGGRSMVVIGLETDALLNCRVAKCLWMTEAGGIERDDFRLDILRPRKERPAPR
jgi:uncharacterized protein YodC (DUF2158 family)